MMKRYILVLLLLLELGLNSYSQNISVKSFRAVPDDMTARVTAPVTDQNGDKCALIKVRTSQKGFVFEGDMNGITKTKQDVGEVWIYLPQKSRRITIKHQQLGVLDKYIYPEVIKEASVYIMELTCGKVTTTVENVEISTQWLTISTTPTDAEVYIDDKYVGQTPFQKLMPTGKYNYRFEKTLYHNIAGIFELNADKRYRIVEELKPNFGFAYIETTPESGAEILIDGVKLGKNTPAKTGKLQSGEHTVTVRKDLYTNTSKKIQILDDQTINVDIAMGANFGGLNLSSSPVAGAEITLDGKLLAKKTPITLEKLSSGEHIIKLKKEWYEPRTIRVTIVENQTKELPVKLLPTFGELSVITNPEADIYINEEKVGRGTYRSRLVAGFYSLEARKEKHHMHKQSLNLAVGEMQNVDLNPRPKYGTLNISTEPFDATIFINGEEKDLSPATFRNLLIGSYQIELKKAGFGTIIKNITVNENQTIELNEILPSGKEVSIGSKPSGANIYDGGTLLGTTPLKTTLAFGTHKIRVTKEGETDTKQINISQNGKTNFDFYVQKFAVPMVLVKGGTFQMGSNNGENDEKPIHSVSVDDFYIGKYEVTQAQWKEVMGFNSSEFEGDNLPVDGAKWEDVQTFIARLNKKSDKTYRLPTEAEWEYAARGGSSASSTIYAGSNDKRSVAWFKSNSDGKTHEVGSKQANELGIYDMSGNVWEWCSDWYDRHYYENSPVNNPICSIPSSYGKVIRGGSWRSKRAYGCRVAYREEDDYGLSDNGFRLACSMVSRDSKKSRTDTKHISIPKSCEMNLDINVENITIPMVFVKGDTFLMGSNMGSDEDIHKVRVDDFYIGKYEVTQAQWKSVMDFNPSMFKGDNLPVEKVSLKKVKQFITKLNKKTGKTFRLPTEAEWEYAARGGVSASSTIYAGSNDMEDVAWYYSNSEGKKHEVGGKQANELGIYDMSGNVWEWCSDWYDSDYYGNSPMDNPKGPVQEQCLLTLFSGREIMSDYYKCSVIRGGSWCESVSSVTDRQKNYILDRERDVGFRLVLILD